MASSEAIAAASPKNRQDGDVAMDVEDVNQRVVQEWQELNDATIRECVNLAQCERSSAEKIQALRQQTYDNLVETSKLEPSSCAADTPMSYSANGDQLAEILGSSHQKTQDLDRCLNAVGELMGVKAILQSQASGASAPCNKNSAARTG